MNATYKQLINHGYTRTEVSRAMTNQFVLDQLTKCAMAKYFLLRYSPVKFSERTSGRAFCSEGTIAVGDTTYIVYYDEDCCTVPYHLLSTCNIEVSFRAALPEYNLPAIALVRPYYGTVELASTPIKNVSE